MEDKENSEFEEYLLSDGVGSKSDSKFNFEINFPFCLKFSEMLSLLLLLLLQGRERNFKKFLHQ